MLLCGCTTFLATKSRRSVDLSGLGLGTIAIRLARRPFLGLNPQKMDSCLTFNFSPFKNSKHFQKLPASDASAHFFARYCKHQSHIISHQSLTPRCHLAVHWTELFVACHGFADVALTRVTFANLLATASRKPQQGVLKKSQLFFRSKRNIWHADKRLSSSPTTKAENFRFKRDPRMSSCPKTPRNMFCLPCQSSHLFEVAAGSLFMLEGKVYIANGEPVVTATIVKACIAGFEEKVTQKCQKLTETIMSPTQIEMIRAHTSA